MQEFERKNEKLEREIEEEKSKSMEVQRQMNAYRNKAESLGREMAKLMNWRRENSDEGHVDAEDLQVC